MDIEDLRKEIEQAKAEKRARQNEASKRYHARKKGDPEWEAKRREYRQRSKANARESGKWQATARRYAQQRYEAATDRMIAYLGGRCKHCNGVFHRAAFDFHHRDPTTKAFALSQNCWRKWEDLVVELDKCDLLCANCHRTHHATRRKAGD